MWGSLKRWVGSTWCWAVPVGPRTELGTKTIWTVFTLQGCQPEVVPRAGTPFSATAASRMPCGSYCSTQQGPDTLKASPRKISSWESLWHIPSWRLSPKTETCRSRLGHLNPPPRRGFGSSEFQIDSFIYQRTLKRILIREGREVGAYGIQ